MATLENAAEELAVRLKGLDSEMEESQHTLEELRGQVEATSREVEQEWSHLAEAVTSLLEKLREEQEQLAAEVREALQATAEASGSVQESGAQARSEIAEGQADLDSLSQHATGLEPGVESLVAEAGEAPAQALAQRAQEVEQELTRVLDDARDFLKDEVAAALGELAEDVRERCQMLAAVLADESTVALQTAFDDWEAGIDELEDYVAEQGFVASHSHARDVVDWAVAECKTACETHLDGMNALVEESVRPLHELAEELQRAGDRLMGGGGELLNEMSSAHKAVGSAVSVLDAVSALLASYTFVRS